MRKPESIYMWENVDNTIQIIEPWIDLINRKTDLCNPNCFPQDNEGCSLKYSHIIGEFMPMKKRHDFFIGLSPNVHPLMNNSLSWKVVLVQGRRISQRYFHHLEMNSYLHKKISPWQMTILFIQWKISIYVIINLDVLCPDVWCLMTSSC